MRGLFSADEQVMRNIIVRLLLSALTGITGAVFAGFLGVAFAVRVFGLEPLQYEGQDGLSRLPVQQISLVVMLSGPLFALVMWIYLGRRRKRSEGRTALVNVLPSPGPPEYDYRD